MIKQTGDDPVFYLLKISERQKKMLVKGIESINLDSASAQCVIDTANFRNALCDMQNNVNAVYLPAMVNDLSKLPGA